MSDILGRQLIIRRPDPENSGQFLNACGLNTKTFSLTNATIDRLRLKCQELDARPSTHRTVAARDVTFSGSGYAEDDVNHKIITTTAIEGAVLEGWQVVIPSIGTFTGDWIVTQVDYTGDETGELGFSVNFVQRDEVVFAAL